MDRSHGLMATTNVQPLEQEAWAFVGVTGEQVAAALGDLVSAVDVAALTGDCAVYVAASFRQALANGIWGWFDDDLAFTRPWGFDLERNSVPVVVWQGRAAPDGPIRPRPVARGPPPDGQGPSCSPRRATCRLRWTGSARSSASWSPALPRLAPERLAILLAIRSL